jgi:hypothetical protein
MAVWMEVLSRLIALFLALPCLRVTCAAQDFFGAKDRPSPVDEEEPSAADEPAEATA